MEARAETGAEVGAEFEEKKQERIWEVKVGEPLLLIRASRELLVSSLLPRLRKYKQKLRQKQELEAISNANRVW